MRFSLSLGVLNHLMLRDPLNWVSIFFVLLQFWLAVRWFRKQTKQNKTKSQFNIIYGALIQNMAKTHHKCQHSPLSQPMKTILLHQDIPPPSLSYVLVSPCYSKLFQAITTKWQACEMKPICHPCRRWEYHIKYDIS